MQSTIQFTEEYLAALLEKHLTEHGYTNIVIKQERILAGTGYANQATATVEDGH